MGRPVELTLYQQGRLRKLYCKDNMSVNSISRKMKLSRSTIYRYVKLLNLKRTEIKNYGGTKIVWTSKELKKLAEGYNRSDITVEDIAKELGYDVSTVTKKASEMGLKKLVKRHITEEDIETIVKLGETKKLKEIAEYMDVSVETLRKAIAEYGIPYKRKNVNLKVPLTSEFFADLRNPRLTGLDVARKYKVTREAILSWRKKLYGTFKLELDHNKRLNEFEYQVTEVLDELDLAYIPHKKVKDWVVDFYLGNKRIIEVNGVVWHSSKKNKDKDKRKMKELKSEGYKVLTIEVDHRISKGVIKRKIKGFLGSPYEKS